MSTTHHSWKFLDGPYARIFFGILVSLSTIAIWHSLAFAQSEIELREESMTYLLGDYIQFSAIFASQSELLDGHIILQIDEVEEIFSFPAVLGDEGQFSVNIPLNEDFSIPAFRKVDYWYLVANQRGTIFESQRFNFVYADNRFSWQSIENEEFIVHWYSGKEDFAKSILDSAAKAILRTQNILPIAGPKKLEIFVYDSTESLQMIMQSAEYAWLAGHSDLEQEKIYLSINDSLSQSLEIERQVPHEVAHLMFYQSLGADTYSKLPKWLDEGIASNAELYSDPLYEQLLKLAYAEGTLPGLFSLCQTFPQDQNLARISYAVADSFLEYLRQEYRLVGIGAIVDAYAANDDCMFALVDLLGENLLELELDWLVSEFEEPLGPIDAIKQIESIEVFTAIIVLIAFISLIRKIKRND